MKKAVVLFLVSTMLFSLSACGGKGGNSGNQAEGSGQAQSAAQSQSQSGTQSVEQSDAQSQSQSDTQGAAKTDTPADAEDYLIPGVLYQLRDLADGEEPVIRGIALAGGSIGSARDNPTDALVNIRPVGTDDIRFVFEQNEWITVYVDSDKTEGLSAYIVPHEKKADGIIDSFIANLDDSVARCDLIKPEDYDEYSLWGWGELYAFNEVYPSGYYDLVFTDGMTPVARVMLKIVDMESLKDYGDKELNALMETEVEEAKKSAAEAGADIVSEAGNGEAKQ